jgi:hypothetical protein
MKTIFEFDTEKEFQGRSREGFVVNQWRDRREPGARIHESACQTLELPGDENHVTEVNDKYWSSDFETLRRAWPGASHCQHCIGRSA